MIFIDLDLETAMARTYDGSGDKFENMGREFFEKVREGYKFVAKKYDFVEVVDGRGSVEEVEKRIWDIIGG